MKNKEFYKDQILECVMNYNCMVAIDKETGEIKPCEMFITCTKCKLNNPYGSCTKVWRKWLEQEHVEPILDEVEKRYLENVIRPFKYRVLYVKKIIFDKNRSCLEIRLKNLFDKGREESVLLPYFYSRKMYVGMDGDKEYTLEELRLFSHE